MPPGIPQCNCVSECHNRTLFDMVRSMMSLTDLPISFWGYALEIAAFKLNRAPSKSVRDIIDRTISSKVRLRRSDTPLRYGVPGGASCETIPHCFKCRPNS